MKKLALFLVVITTIYLHILPGKALQINPPEYQILTNPRNQYTMTLSGDFYTDFKGRNVVFSDDLLEIYDREGRFSTSLDCIRLDDSVLSAMRKDLADPDLTTEEAFQKLFEVKKSYFPSMEDYYRKKLLFQYTDNVVDQSTMKIFSQDIQSIYGQKSQLFLFNTISSSEKKITEKAHISVLVPVSSNNTIYHLHISMLKENLNDKAVKKINNLIKSLIITGASIQWENLSILNDSGLLSKIREGIYPSSDSKREITINHLNLISKYKLQYPNTLIPSAKNNLINSFYYQSFRFDLYTSMNIIVHPIENESTAVVEKVNSILRMYSGKIRLYDGSIMDHNGTSMYFLKYVINEPTSSRYYMDYYAVHDSKLYNLQLESNFKAPSASDLLTFKKAVDSFEFIAPGPVDQQPPETAFTNYSDSSSGMTISYPQDWVLTINSILPKGSISSNPYISIKNPDFSGPLDISVWQGSIIGEWSGYDMIQILTDKNADRINRLVGNYPAPYLNHDYRLLSSVLTFKKDAVYVYKLINYMDESSRGKFCWSLDIIRGQKIYSLLINISDYAVTDGRISDPELNILINRIAASFMVK